MKTLYLSDLDGTLLNSNECISEYTANAINQFVKKGGCFSYATARSIVTASKVTVDLDIKLPVICYNGAFMFKNDTNEILLSNYFTPEEVEIASNILDGHDIYPIVYAYVDGVERFSYIEKYVTPTMRHFLNSRVGDPRRRSVSTAEALYSGQVFYFVCIGAEDSLFPINKIFKKDNRFNCIYQKDIYSGGQWCELLPIKAAKDIAALQLKSMLGCNKMVAFGDGHNDLSLFAAADECYAVANAVPELKKIATAVIGSNDSDGVAKWLEGCVTAYPKQ